MTYILYIYPWTNISDNVMPYCKTYTETVVAVTVPIVVVEVEWTCVRIVVVTTAFEEWIIVAVVNTDKIRVGTGIFPCFSLKLCSNEKFSLSIFTIYI